VALSTHVTDRYGTDTGFILNLTNLDSEAATIDATRLGLATDAAEADFPTYAGIAYDDTAEAHISAGVMGAIAYLRSWSSKQGASEDSLSKFWDRLRSIRSVGPGKRITPIAVAPAAREDDEDLFLGVSPDNPEKSTSP
jgi:hypothetical protein